VEGGGNISLVSFDDVWSRWSSFCVRSMYYIVYTIYYIIYNI